MAVRLDHLMWGAPSLEAGMAEAERLFGVRPAPGGVHPGLGTCNALLSLGEDQYLEVIAPDPEQDLSGNLGGRLATLESPSLITWAAAAPDLAGLANRAAERELTVRGPIPTERSTPAGATLRWELLFVGGHDFGAQVPFFIDWLQTPHPAATNPSGGRFVSLAIHSNRAHALNGLFEGLGMDVRAVEAADNRLEATIDTASGEVVLGSIPDTAAWTL